MQTEGHEEVLQPTSGQVLRLAEVRHDLLIRLNQLNDPTLALQKLDEFRLDIATYGVEYALMRWSSKLIPSGSS